jgi:hypothetical protein
MSRRTETCNKCGQPCDEWQMHGNFRDRGDGFCEGCGRDPGWHAGSACYCRLATGMPAPLPRLTEIPPPPGEPLRIYSVVDHWVAFYEGGICRDWNGGDTAWSDPEELWPERRHWMAMLKPRRGNENELTDAGRRMLGLPVAVQMELGE